MSPYTFETAPYLHPPVYLVLHLPCNLTSSVPAPPGTRLGLTFPQPPSRSTTCPQAAARLEGSVVLQKEKRRAREQQPTGVGSVSPPDGLPHDASTGFGASAKVAEGQAQLDGLKELSKEASKR